MYVVLGAACGEQHDPFILRHGCEVTPERLRIRDRVDPLFRAEHAMNKDRGMGVRHTVSVDAEALHRM